MKFITKQQLMKLGACDGLIERFERQTNNASGNVDIVSIIGGENTADDFLWLAGKSLDNNKIVRFTCDLAMINIKPLEKYADDFNLILGFLDNPRFDDDILSEIVWKSIRRCSFDLHDIWSNANPLEHNMDEVANSAKIVCRAKTAAMSVMEAVNSVKFPDSEYSAACASRSVGHFDATAWNFAEKEIADRKVNDLLVRLFS